ncbi:6422_t:CDS:10, partial [Ambispora gerdemannii]
EDGCYEDLASSHRKKNLSNMHRYLTKLTEHQICIMSETDLNNINWQAFGTDNESDSEDDEYDENNIFYDFEVKKSQEQKENFELYPGFEVHIPKLSIRENSLTNEGIPLHPLIVESVSNQTLLTREILPATKYTERGHVSFDSINNLREYFKVKLETQKCALHLSRQLKMEQLEIIVKDCLKMPELFAPYIDATKALKIEKKEKIAMAEESIKKKADNMEKIALQLLHDSYSRFEEMLTGAKSDSDQAKADFRSDKNSIGLDSSLESMRLVDETTFKELREEYPQMYSEIQTTIKRINNVSWQAIKKRYIFAKLYTLYNQDPSNSKELTISAIFFDKTKDLYKLIKKIIQPAKEGNINVNVKFIISEDQTINNSYEILLSLDEQEKKTTDDVFTRQLIENNVDMLILTEFFEKYKNWRNNTFLHVAKRISQKILNHNSSVNIALERKFNLKEHDIKIQNVERICAETESRYPEGELFTVLDLEKKREYYGLSTTYKMLREFEKTRPAQLQITLFQTQLSQQDTLELEKNVFHIPQPILYSYRRSGISLEIDQETFEFRHIAQMEKKILVFLWNKITKKLEIYFDTINRLPKIIFDQSAIKKINPGEHCMITVNEPKGLIGIYSNEKGVLNTYSLEQDQTNFSLHYRNIQLCQWYNDTMPDITNFFFIKNTEDICFVERD